MTEREIRSYDYVNQPYEPVRDALKQGAASVFERATRLAEARRGSCWSRSAWKSAACN